MAPPGEVEPLAMLVLGCAAEELRGANKGAVLGGAGRDELAEEEEAKADAEPVGREEEEGEGREGVVALPSGNSREDFGRAERPGAGRLGARVSCCCCDSSDC